MTRSRIRRLAATFVAIVFAVFIVIQFVPVDRTNPPVLSEIPAPAEVMSILRRSCYDCHSHETRWPWYAYVAPASWFLVDHIEDGRRDLNFSDWPVFDFEEQALALGDVRDQLTSGEMPLRSYLLLHPEARLNEAERKILLDWAASGF